MSKTIKRRQNFLDFFRANNHRFMKPSKVYNDDPTLFFVNAGMNQLKDVFLGQSEIPKLTRLMNSQICVRAGGKHNDLDDVGFDSYHLTSFEMLGNWSLNEYGRKDAIHLAYTYLVQECGLKPEQLYVTYFEGTPEIEADDETKKEWLEIVPDERIVKGSFKDNFWMMGDYGPCGVSTEIHYDLIGDRDASSLVNQDDPTVIEIWNLVFITYNRIETEGGGGKYEKLDKFYVDTGMGLERLSMVMQGAPTIYQTDSFRFLIGYAQALTGGRYFTDSYGDDVNLVDTSYRIFADHIRTTVVSLFDGVKFGLYGREFILRKIFRRLLTYTYTYLMEGEVKEVMGHPLVRCLISDILNYFLYKTHDAEKIQRKLIKEETLFIGKVKNVQRKYLKLRKEKNVEETISILHESQGIPELIVKHMDKLRFH